MKLPNNAKQRLTNTLSTDERYHLVHAMFTDVLNAIAEARNIAGLAIITGDDAIAAIARSRDAMVITTAADKGQSEAVTKAASVLRAAGVKRLLTLPGDVPLISAQEIDELAACIRKSPAIAIAKNRDGTGTNSIACTAAINFPFSFGENSFQRHRSLALDANLAPTILSLPGLSLDIDNYDDLISLLAIDARTATHSFLWGSGIAGRLLSASRYNDLAYQSSMRKQAVQGIT